MEEVAAEGVLCGARTLLRFVDQTLSCSLIQKQRRCVFVCVCVCVCFFFCVCVCFAVSVLVFMFVCVCVCLLGVFAWLSYTGFSVLLFCFFCLLFLWAG